MKSIVNLAFCATVFVQIAVSAPALSAGGVQQAKPWLGVAIDQGSEGVLVKNALKGTPAEKAGFRGGDEILSVDGAKVRSPKELIQLIQSKGVGHSVTIVYVRDKVKRTLQVQLVVRPDTLAVLKKQRLGAAAPEFQLPVIAGNLSGKLADHRGKVVILEFWATWCPACLSTHTRLSTAADTLKKKGLVVLAISDEETEVLERFAKETQHSFTILQDRKRTVHGDWFVPAIPTLAVIDRQGVVRHVAVGAGRYLDETLAVAEQLLGGS